MKKTVVIVVIILGVLVIGILSFMGKYNNKEYKNTLSQTDTFDRFINLVEDGEYEEAKKYTTNNFSADLSTIKSINFSKRNKDYDLSGENKYVYVDIHETGYYKMTRTYYFELENTNYGWKVNKFYEEIESNENEINSLIY